MEVNVAGGPAADHRQRLGYAQRLHDPREFQRVYAAQKAIHAPNLVVFYCPNDLGQARLGVSVGSRHGNAVRRNRIKRVLRAAFRQCRSLLPPGMDYVLVPKRGVKEYTAAAVRETLETVGRKIVQHRGTESTEEHRERKQ